MLIDCPTCARAYQVNPADIGPRGRTVICPRCSTHWMVRGEGVRTGEDLLTDAVSARATDRLRFHERAFGGAAVPGPWRAAAAGLACLALATGVVGARERVVRALPRTAALYAAAGLPVNLRGLSFTALAPGRLASNDVVVAGTIRNAASHRISVPLLSFVVRDVGGRTLMTWREHAKATALGAGRTLAFTSAPHHVPPDATSVLVRFEDGEDDLAKTLVSRAERPLTGAEF